MSVLLLPSLATVVLVCLDQFLWKIAKGVIELFPQPNSQGQKRSVTKQYLGSSCTRTNYIYIQQLFVSPSQNLIFRTD